MAASPPVAALPWYDRRDYPALLKLFSDSHRLQATYAIPRGLLRIFERASLPQ